MGVRKRLVVMDVDSTFITNEQIDLLADFAGVGDEVAKITEQAMQGELDFTASLTRRVALLAGLPAELLDKVREQLTVNDGVEKFVEQAHHNGWPIALISGGFHNILDEFMARFPISFLRANTLEVTEGVLTGKVIGPIIDQAAKARGLVEFAAETGVEVADCIAIGDGANDRDMVMLAGVGVAFHAKPALVEVADIVIPDGPLTALWDLLASSEAQA